MSLLVRQAAAGDFEAIYRLNRDSLSYDYPIEKTKARLTLILQDENAHVLVAELDGDVVGYIHSAGYNCAYSDPLKNILAIAVDTRFQGRGIGRALLGAAEDWAKETGAVGVRLVSGMNREKAHLFYGACGYMLRKTQKNFIKML